MKSSKFTGRNIKAFRERLFLSQQEVADFLGVSREMISYWENGQREISLKILEKLSDLFGVELINLLEENEDIAQVDLAFAFRTEDLTKSDLEQISTFNKIVRNYLKIQEIKNKNED
jgi:transcriptional regulator with XRE-family HTH domain